MSKKLILAALALAASSTAFAKDHGHKHWRDHGRHYAPAPVYVVPAPRVVYAPAPVYYYHPVPVYHQPAPVYYQPAPVYHQPAPVYQQPAVSIRFNFPL